MLNYLVCYKTMRMYIIIIFFIEQLKTNFIIITYYIISRTSIQARYSKKKEHALYFSEVFLDNILWG